MQFIFKQTNELIRSIEEFIDITREGSLHFKKALSLFLENKIAEFEERVAIISENEHNADSLKKIIESKLYLRMLLPESRGDVLTILETMDKITNRSKSVIKAFSVERPEIPEDVKSGMLELAEAADKAVEALVAVVRAYFDNAHNVHEKLHLVKFYEKEADVLSEKIKRDIFAYSTPLAVKLQLRDFISGIDGLADSALDVADVVSIAAARLIV